MEIFDHLIIGGGIAGTVAAETIRTRDAQATIAIVGAETHRLYSRVMLPHVLRGKTTEEKAFLRSEDFYEDKRISFLRGAKVASVDADARRVTLADGTILGYSKALLIATGGDARPLKCPGVEAADPMYFQTLDDTRRIAATSARSALVYGGGFIAMEFHMSFNHMGIRTVAAMRGDGFFARVLDTHGRALIMDEFKKRGIEVHTGVEIKGTATIEGVKKVFLTDGSEIMADAVAVGIGLEPNVGFLAGSGIAVDVGVVVDAQLRASVPGVFAAGDIAECPDPFSGDLRMIGNWQNAMFQGKVAGANMTGGDETYAMLTTYSISCFGLPVTFVGEAELPSGERIVRESADGSLQLILKNGCVVGATCVGPYTDRAAVSKLITEKIEFTPSMRSAAADTKTPLISLLS